MMSRLPNLDNSPRRAAHQSPGGTKPCLTNDGPGPLEDVTVHYVAVGNSDGMGGRVYSRWKRGNLSSDVPVTGRIWRRAARKRPSQIAHGGLMMRDDAPVAERVDATDLKSVGRKAMQVRLLPGAPARRLQRHGEGPTGEGTCAFCQGGNNLTAAQRRTKGMATSEAAANRPSRPPMVGR